MMRRPTLLLLGTWSLSQLIACSSSSSSPTPPHGSSGGADNGSAGGNANSGGQGSTAGSAQGGAASGTQGGSTNNGAGAGGAAAGSAGMTSAGGSSTGGSSTGGSSGVSGTWHGATSATVTSSMLQTEYDAWKKAHAQACSNGSWVVVKDGSVVSEGIGYGMLLAAGMNDQPLFDNLWKYYQDHLDANGLMNWATGLCDSPGNNKANAATDGDLDTAMALVQAATRWPGGNYLASAQALSEKIAQFESEDCSGRRILKPGDVFGGCSDMNGQNKINPSYFAPAYYKVFAHYFPDQAATWSALTDGSYELYAMYQARLANLVPDWSKYDGSDWYGAGYSYDACRTPFRVAVDYDWSGDARAKTFLTNISTWIDGHGGLPSAAQQQNSAFIGAFALAGSYDATKFNGYMSAWLGANMDDTPYFQGTLRVLYLLVAAGRFSSTL
jgi:endo-1,4-beta-D-glucanase Y